MPRERAPPGLFLLARRHIDVTHELLWERTRQSLARLVPGLGPRAIDNPQPPQPTLLLKVALHGFLVCLHPLYALFERFHNLVTTQAEPDLAALGKLAVFAGVREFPMRVKCASLAWHTLEAALDQQSDAVSTE